MFRLLSNSDTRRRRRKLQLGSYVILVLRLFAANSDLTDAVSPTNNQDILRYPQSLQNTINEFSNYLVIKPEIHHGRHKRAIKDTYDKEEGGHVPHIVLSYHHEGHKVIADLHLNENLFPEGHFLRFQNSTNGGDTVQKFTRTEVDLCHYQGTIRGKSQSRVAVSTCNGGINGVIFDDQDTYFIHSDSDGRLQDDHFLLKYDDMVQNATCGYGNSNSKGNHHHPNDDNAMHHMKSSEYNRILRYKRSNPDSNFIRGPYNANGYSSIVELVIVVDHEVYKGYGENMKKVQKLCQDLASIVNSLYVPLNIFVALVGVVVWNESNEIKIYSNASKTLKNFLDYRLTDLSLTHPNDNAQLLTNVDFESNEVFAYNNAFTRTIVGKALVGTICSYQSSGGVISEHSKVAAILANTMAHEMGHNFGMEHDSPDCECVDKKCIMADTISTVLPHHWSSCSLDQLDGSFSRGMNNCLRNKPAKLFESPQCGNGFVEPGEQCDCGLPQYCDNSCCDANTCMLGTNALCATGECCDLSTCRPKTAGTQCRSAEGECDLAEYCTGESEYCPIDVYKRNTEVCGDGNAFCYQGSCKSRTNQCKILWGPSGRESSRHCYWNNINGSSFGNCGYDQIQKTYMPCQTKDVYCGMLHCTHSGEGLQIGTVAVLSKTSIFIGNSLFQCANAVVDLGPQSIDPGLTPNGAKCGENKMCVNQKCVAIEALHAKEEEDSGPGGSEDSGPGGSEDSGPGGSEDSGPGGSEDSGPAMNPNKPTGFNLFMLIFFLGVVPFILAVMLLVYYWKSIPCISKKSSSVYVTNPTQHVNTTPTTTTSSSSNTATKPKLQVTDIKLNFTTNPNAIAASGKILN